MECVFYGWMEGFTGDMKRIAPFSPPWIRRLIYLLLYGGRSSAAPRRAPSNLSIMQCRPGCLPAGTRRFTSHRKSVIVYLRVSTKPTVCEMNMNQEQDKFVPKYYYNLFSCFICSRFRPVPPIQSTGICNQFFFKFNIPPNLK